MNRWNIIIGLERRNKIEKENILIVINICVAVYMGLWIAHLQVNSQKEIQKYQFEMKKREQATLISNYLSLMTSRNIKGYSNKDSMNNLRKTYEINQIVIEMALWLPFDVYKKLRLWTEKLLSPDINPKMVMDELYDIVIECRNYIMEEDEMLNPDDIFLIFKKDAFIQKNKS